MVLGCPIRKSTDQIKCADPRGLSQLITSFIASESLGILHAPLIRLRVLVFLLSFASQYVNELVILHSG
jgi:hypothetical protein